MARLPAYYRVRAADQDLYWSVKCDDLELAASLPCVAFLDDLNVVPATKGDNNLILSFEDHDAVVSGKVLMDRDSGLFISASSGRNLQLLPLRLGKALPSFVWGTINNAGRVRLKAGNALYANFDSMYIKTGKECKSEWILEHVQSERLEAVKQAFSDRRAIDKSELVGLYRRDVDVILTRALALPNDSVAVDWVLAIVETFLDQLHISTALKKYSKSNAVSAILRLLESLPERFFVQKDEQSNALRHELCGALAKFYPPEASPKLHRLAVEIVRLASSAERLKVILQAEGNLHFIRATVNVASPVLSRADKDSLVASALSDISGKSVRGGTWKDLFEFYMGMGFVASSVLADAFAKGL
jgi:hypothetical protein